MAEATSRIMLRRWGKVREFVGECSQVDRFPFGMYWRISAMKSMLFEQVLMILTRFLWRMLRSTSHSDWKALRALWFSV